jgi:hypothetical protein
MKGLTMVRWPRTVPGGVPIAPVQSAQAVRFRPDAGAVSRHRGVSELLRVFTEQAAIPVRRSCHPDSLTCGYGRTGR